MDFHSTTLLRAFSSLLLLFLTITPLLLIVNPGTAKGAETNCSIDAADECAHQLYIYGSDETRFAANAREQRAKCKKNKDFEKCVKDYSAQCTKPFVRQYVNIMMSGPIQVAKSRCGRRGIPEFLKHKGCLDATKPAIDACNKIIVEDSTLITTAPDRSKWIPITCCFLSKGTVCSNEAILSSCADKESQSYVSDSVKSMLGDIYDLLCGKQYAWGTEKCTQLTSPLRHKAGNTKRPKSILPVALDMIEKYLSSKQ